MDTLNNMTERERKQAFGLLAAPPEGMGDITAATVLMLQMLGNPLATLETDDLQPYHLAEAAWVHCAPRETVRGLLAHGDRELVKLAVLEWADTLPPAALDDMQDYLVTAADGAMAGLALVSDPATAQKNGLATAERESGNSGSSGRSGDGGVLPQQAPPALAGAGVACAAGEQRGDTQMGARGEH